MRPCFFLQHYLNRLLAWPNDGIIVFSIPLVEIVARNARRIWFEKHFGLHRPSSGRPIGNIPWAA